LTINKKLLEIISILAKAVNHFFHEM
jgi:hypothetical protein